MRTEDRDICKECGGFCCKKSGCDYSPKDFKDLGIKALVDILNEGNVSIVAAFDYSVLRDGTKVPKFHLYLRARNIDRGPVDLFSFKKQCSMLTETGCSYDLEHRPFGGANLVPVGMNPKTKLPDCYVDENPLNIIMSWESYQNTLRKAVKRITGNTVEKQFELDAEEVFYQTLMEDFEGINRIEIQDMLSGLPMIAEMFPEAYKRALARKKKNTCILEIKKN